MKAFMAMKTELGDSYSEVFRSITTVNGSEFSQLSELEQGTQTKVYFAHPYTSCEKGAIENHNGLIHRFIPKGKCIEDYSARISWLSNCGLTDFPGESWTTRHRTRLLKQKWTKSSPPETRPPHPKRLILTGNMLNLILQFPVR